MFRSNTLLIKFNWEPHVSIFFAIFFRKKRSKNLLKKNLIFLPSIYTINLINMYLNARKKARKRTKRVETDDASSGGDKNLRMQLRIPHVNRNGEGACD